jgi:FkbM family methyltransferase
MQMKALVVDPTTGELDTGWALPQRFALMSLTLGARMTGLAHHHGLSRYCRAFQMVLPDQDITLRLADDSLFCFPFGDPYWTRLLDPGSRYEPEVDAFLRAVADVDYEFIDCGANFGFWSVAVTSRAYGLHASVAIEPSPDNCKRLWKNCRINGDRFRILQKAVGSKDGSTARLTGSKHEGLTIANGAGAAGIDVGVVSLDGLMERGLIRLDKPLVVKLDVEGMEIETIKGASKLLGRDVAIICEEHRNDESHAVTRYLLEQHDWLVFVFEPASHMFMRLTDLETLHLFQARSAPGYNVFATKSKFWSQEIGRIGRIRSSATARERNRSAP